MKKIIVTLLIVLIFSSFCEAIELQAEPLWAQSNNGFEIGEYGEKNILFTFGLSESPSDFVSDNLALSFYELTLHEIKKLNFSWDTEVQLEKGYDNPIVVFCDFDADGLDELFIAKNFLDIFMGEIYIYKINFKNKKLELIWKKDIEGCIFDYQKINDNKILLHIENLSVSFLSLIGEKGNRLDTLWERRYTSGEALEQLFLVLNEKELYIRKNEEQWEKLYIYDDEVTILGVSTNIENILKYNSDRNLNVFERIGILNLDDDKELETIKKIEDGNYLLYSIYAVESNSKKYEIKIPLLDSIEGYISTGPYSYPKVIFANGYSVFFSNGQYIYTPWIEQLESYNKKIWNLRNKDIDQDGIIESLFLRGKPLNVSDNFSKVVLWIVK